MIVPPTTMRFTEDEKALLDAHAAYLTAKHGIPQSRTSVIRHILRKVTPPTENTPEARALRVAHHRIFGERT